MLVSLPPESNATLEELLRDARARVRQFGEVHTDEDLFGASDPLRRALLRLALAVLDLALWIAFLVALRRGAGPVPTLGLLGAALAGLLAERVTARVLRRRTRRHADAARVGLGALIQANADLWDPENREERFGALVVTTDPELERDPRRLLELARRIGAWAKAGLEPVPEAMGPIVAHVRSEVVTYEERRRVPAEIAGNDRTWVLDVLFFPSEMPHGFVDRRLWPVLVHAEDCSIPPVALARELWWSPETDHLWRGAEGTEPPDAEPVAPPPERGPTEPAAAAPESAASAASADRAPARSPAEDAPTIACRKHRPSWLLLRTAGAGFGLLLALLLAAAFAGDPERRPALLFFSAVGAGALGYLALLLRARRARLVAGPRDLVRHGLLAPVRVPWHAVVGVTHADGRLSARVRRKERTLRFTVRGRAADRRALADAIVARAPRLAGLAWATGLREARPAPHEAELPHRVEIAAETLRVEGPGSSQLVLEPGHPRHAAVRAALERRLLPVLRDASSAPAGDAGADLDVRGGGALSARRSGG